MGRRSSRRTAGGAEGARTLRRPAGAQPGPPPPEHAGSARLCGAKQAGGGGGACVPCPSVPRHGAGLPHPCRPAPQPRGGAAALPSRSMAGGRSDRRAVEQRGCSGGGGRRVRRPGGGGAKRPERPEAEGGCRPWRGGGERPVSRTAAHGFAGGSAARGRSGRRRGRRRPGQAGARSPAGGRRSLCRGFSALTREPLHVSPWAAPSALRSDGAPASARPPPPLGGRERRRAASPGRAGWLGPAGRRPPGCGAEAGCEASGTSALGGVSRFGPSAVLWPGGVWESGNLFFSRGRLRIVWLQWPTNFPGCFSWVLRLFRTFGGGFVLSILNTYNPTIFWLGVR